MTAFVVRARVKGIASAKASEGDGTRQAPATPPASRAARMLALAHHIEQLIDAGELADYAEAARRLGITRARLSQVMALTLLGPVVQEWVLTGELKSSPRSIRRLVAHEIWDRQLSELPDNRLRPRSRASRPS